jgi:hypothetical protein
LKLLARRFVLAQPDEERTVSVARLESDVFRNETAIRGERSVVVAAPFEHQRVRARLI